ncbi:MAG: tetratricopeptide repeat protein [Sedimentisphaerales bacterium]|nr:tetratricopeptide repeat protein [Sedimentisphaerales bacterium]
MSKTSKKNCRTAIMMFLIISLVMPPASVLAAGKAAMALQSNITGSWVNESIDKVLMDLADMAKVDIITSPDVTGNVTAKVTDVPLEEALTNILAAHNCTYVATDNMIRVTALSEITLAKDQLISKVYQITYADANEVAASLSRFVSDKGSVAFNKGTSHIAVTDTEKKIKAVDKFIRQVDQQTQQVLVEVKIYEIKSEEGFKLDSSFYAGRTQEYETDGLMGKTTTTTKTTPAYDVTKVMEAKGDPVNGSEWSTQETYRVSTWGTVLTDTEVVDNTTWTDKTETTTESHPAITETETTVVQEPTGQYVRKRGKPYIGGSFDRQQGGTLKFSLLDDAVDFEFALSMLKKEIESKLLANPRILVMDNETANFEIVREIPYREMMQTAREDPISYTDFKNVGVQLKVTPHIARGGLIKLQIAPEFGMLVSQGLDGAPTVDARRADTTALIRDGQTIAIGGLRKRETSIDIAKVPVLGDMPLVKGLFRSKTESEIINELVVLITPRIINGSEAVPAELSPDGENGIPKAFGGAGQAGANVGEVIDAGDYEPMIAAESTGSLTETDPTLMLKVGYGYLKMGRFEQARDMLETLIAREPANGKAHQYLGYCNLKLGDIDSAIENYATAVDLDDTDFEAHRGLGVAYMVKARSTKNSALAEKAIEQWQVSLDIKPNQPNSQALAQMIEVYSQ